MAFQVTPFSRESLNVGNLGSWELFRESVVSASASLLGGQWSSKLGSISEVELLLQGKDRQVGGTRESTQTGGGSMQKGLSSLGKLRTATRKSHTQTDHTRSANFNKIHKSLFFQ